MFKRTILAALALSILAAPMAQAQGYRDGPRPGYHQVQPAKPTFKKAPSRHQVHKPAPRKKPSWKRGHRYSEWKRHQAVRDYHRYGLRRPGRGEEWIRVGNDYLLISIATGIILGIAAGR